MRPTRLLAILLICALFGTVLGTPVRAQEPQPADPADGVSVFSRFPALEIATGDSVSFSLTVRSTGEPQIVRLSTDNLPEGWTATFRGEGRVIQSVYVEPEQDVAVDLRLDPAEDVEPGVYSVAVLVQAAGDEVRFPLEVTVQDKLPAGLEFDVELPVLRGAPDTTFRYNATLSNTGDEDVDVNLLAEAPAGIIVDFLLNGQSVTSIPLAANESRTLSIEAELFPDLPSGAYEFSVLATGAAADATETLVAEVIGRSNLSVSGLDGRLSGEISAGTTSPLSVIVSNDGTAVARNITLSASQPAGWTVEFTPAQIPELAGGQQIEVTANVQPAEQVLPGDYVVTMRATPEDGAPESAEFRITVLTSTLWGLVGVVLIAVAVGVVGLAVMRFGRR